jgi:hypothetical protein
MTGKRVPAARLHEHDQIHLEPHAVDGRMVGRRETDVEVVAVFEVCGHTVVWWQGCAAFLGGDQADHGATVYELEQDVVRIGHVAA